MHPLFIICHLLFGLTTSVLALEKPYKDDMAIDPQHIITLDFAIKELNSGNSEYRETVIHYLYDRLASSHQIKSIDVAELFPSFRFKKFTPQEMSAFLIIYHRRNVPLPSAFITEVTKRLASNDPTAQVIMGGIHKHGLAGFPKFPAIAIDYYEQAAKQGDAKALFQLAAMAYPYEGIDKDDSKTLQLLMAAAEKGDIKSVCVLLDMYSKNKLPNCYSSQFANCLNKVMEKNPTNAYLIVEVYYAQASLYYHGYGVAQDFSEAAKWLKKAAPHKTDSKYILGVMYLKGQGVKRDLSKGMQYIQQAAAEGHKGAQFVIDFIKSAKKDS